MSRKSSVALIISTYNWIDALSCSLSSILTQTIYPDEVIIADDGSDSPTKDLINRFSRDNRELNIKHIWIDNIGFRKSVALNQAIKEVKSDYIIQIDGDIIMHPNFIEDHLDIRERNSFICGSRIFLKEKISKKIVTSKRSLDITPFSSNIKNRINTIRSRHLSKIITTKSNDYNVRGCNISFWREDILKINGYNEDLLGWGKEDSDLAVRLNNSNVVTKRLYNEYCG